MGNRLKNFLKAADKSRFSRIALYKEGNFPVDMTMESKTDAELIRAYARTEDNAAFAEIVARHGGMVYGVCYSFVHDSAGLSGVR